VLGREREKWRDDGTMGRRTPVRFACRTMGKMNLAGVGERKGERRREGERERRWDEMR